MLIRHLDSAPVSLRSTDRIEIVSVCDNVTDVLLPDEGPAKRFRGRRGEGSTTPAPLLVGGVAAAPPLAQHGFSSLVRVQGEARVWTILFDTGATTDGCIVNLERLGIDPSEIDAVVLSHGHYDHVTGLSGLAPVLGPKKTPVIVHPFAFRERRFPLADGHRELPTLDRGALEQAGFVVHAHSGPTLLADDRLLVTGEVERSVEFERGLPGQQANVDGSWESDATMSDDQALVVDLAEQGLVIMTGCGHSGIVNITRHGRRMTGRDHVHAVLGGFHLGGRGFEHAIEPTVEQLAELAPDVIVPTHCTGWRAIASIAETLPDAFIHNSVGTTFDFSS